MSWRPAAQACERESEKIAALGWGEGVDFVDDYGLQIFEEDTRVLGGDEQAQLFWRGEENIGRMRALALTA